jgi:hypothetical protein
MGLHSRTVSLWQGSAALAPEVVQWWCNVPLGRTEGLAGWLTVDVDTCCWTGTNRHKCDSVRGTGCGREDIKAVVVCNSVHYLAMIGMWTLQNEEGSSRHVDFVGVWAVFCATCHVHQPVARWPQCILA